MRDGRDWTDGVCRHTRSTGVIGCARRQLISWVCSLFFFFFQAEDGIRDLTVTGVQTCALPICLMMNMARHAGLAAISLAVLLGLDRATPLAGAATHYQTLQSLGQTGASGQKPYARSEERRVGKEGRSRWAPYHLKKKTDVSGRA